jgi:hypothetical protein
MTTSDNQRCSHPWRRVNQANPCPQCSHNSWCLVNDQANLCLCMREQSQRQKILKSGEVGWLHYLRSRTPASTPARKWIPSSSQLEPQNFQATALLCSWRSMTSPSHIQMLATKLCVSPQSLENLGTAWAAEHRAWAFPMTDGHDQVVGIRLRNDRGDKWAVTGSHQGCFVPAVNAQPMALVAEGPTDCAAGVTLGYYCVGRPSCSGGVNDLRQLLRRHGVRSAAIVGDNDKPGLDGARRLSENLGMRNCIVVLPTKDLREFLRLGGSSSLLESMIQASLWRSP